MRVLYNRSMYLTADGIWLQLVAVIGTQFVCRGDPLTELA